MKITEAHLEANQESLGLKKIDMMRLGEVVVITGQNGAGKSRLIKVIQKQLQTKPLKDVKLVAERNKIDNQNVITRWQQQLDTIPKTDIAGIRRLEHNIKTNQNAIMESEKILSHNTLLTDYESENKYVFLDFKPKSLQLKDPDALTKDQIINNADTIEKTEQLNWHDTVLSKVQLVQNQWWNATHQGSVLEQSAKAKLIAEYERLQKCISLFLKTELGRGQNDSATLFGFAIGRANLSDGQKILLQLCIAIYSLEAKLEDIVLFIDEPENSLHPSALIETIDTIREKLENGQLWIATHSINLIAHLSNIDPYSIWYMEDGGISNEGKRPEKVLNGLIGDEMQQAKLADFLSLPAQLATLKFAYECLIEPQSVLTSSGDPQVRQVIAKLASGEKVKVLDFGAGKGRLISAIAEYYKEKGENVADKIDYFAYNLDDTDDKECLANISKGYKDSETRYFNSSTKLNNDFTKNADVVIMMNVFHEIEPNIWKQEMDRVASQLNKDGCLLIVEDQQIPVGEKAYKQGFIVFDKGQFKILFGLANYETVERQDGRLKAHVIPKSALANITDATKRDALENHKNTSRDEINRLRTLEANYPNGKLHAFWTQQFANASLALSG